jgi:LytS/YehU family sensor histidine kinase
LFFVVLRIQHILLHRKYKKEQNLAELKLRSIRNQMDPHFTFNAVNAIGAAIFKEDKDTAYRYFTKFSKLIRSTMLYSDKLSRFLDEEIDFTRKYLEIEKFRFREKFNFEINVDETIDLGNEVPRMIVQSLAETAVNNRLMHRLEGGILKIDIFEKNEVIEIVVTDNGVGMERSKELNKEKAFKSVKIMEEFISGINELNDKPITLEMFDIFESGAVAGTRVIVKVPYGIRYCADTEVINKPLQLFHP